MLQRLDRYERRARSRRRTALRELAAINKGEIHHGA